MGEEAKEEVTNVGHPTVDSVFVVWVVACVLRKIENAGSGLTQSISQTISYRSNCSEDEARGAAVSFALKEKPNHDIALVSTAKIEIPINNKEAKQ